MTKTLFAKCNTPYSIYELCLMRNGVRVKLIMREFNGQLLTISQSKRFNLPVNYSTVSIPMTLNNIITGIIVRLSCVASYSHA